MIQLTRSGRLYDALVAMDGWGEWDAETDEATILMNRNGMYRAR